MATEHEAIELAETFATIARALLAEEDEQATLQRIVEMAVDTIDGCDHAAISLIRGRKMISTSVSSSDVPPQVDAVQYETDEGPCLDAIWEDEVVLVDDLASDSRWPNFAKLAYDKTGVASMLAFRLFAESDTMGALNLYSERTSAFDDHDEALGAVFATHAAVAMAHARTEEQLQKALVARDVIGQAKGVVMAGEHVTEEQAFDLLRRASQRLNIKLRDVAQRVADTGQSPEDLR